MSLTQIDRDVKFHAGQISDEERNLLISLGYTNEKDKIIVLADILHELQITNDMRQYMRELSKLLSPETIIAIYVYEQWRDDIPNITPEHIIQALSDAIARYR